MLSLNHPNHNSDKSAKNDPIPPAALAARALLDHASVDGSDFEQSFEAITADVIEIAKSNNLAWEEFTSICSGLDYTKYLEQPVSQQPNIPQILNDYVQPKTRLKTKRLSDDIRELFIISSRIQGRNIALKQTEYVPRIFDMDFDVDSVISNVNIMKDALILVPSATEIARTQDELMQIISEQIQKTGTESMIEWVRGMSLNPSTEQIYLLRMLAQNVCSDKSGMDRLIDLAESKDDELRTSQFADSLEQSDDSRKQNSSKHQIKTWLDFIQLVNGSDIEVSEMLNRVPQQNWPELLLSAYNSFKNDSRKTDKELLHKLLLPYYESSRRSPSIKDLKRFEHLCDADGASSNRASKNNNNSSRDPQSFLPKVSEPEVKKIELRPLYSGRIIEGKITIDQSEGSISSLTKDFIEKFTLSEKEKVRLQQDVGKMLARLQDARTLDKGVTTLEKVKLQLGDKQVSIKRLNPIYSHGLSVGKIAKDTRIVYCDGLNGEIVVLGILSHDDYDRLVANIS